MSEFKTRYSLPRREMLATRAVIQYKDKVPVIIEKMNHSKLDGLPKEKYLIPRNNTVKDVMMGIRNQIKLNSKQALFIFIGSAFPNPSEQIEAVYNKHRDRDGFLYISYAEENTFG